MIIQLDSAAGNPDAGKRTGRASRVDNRHRCCGSQAARSRHWSEAQPRFCGHAEDMGQRFKYPSDTDDHALTRRSTIGLDRTSGKAAVQRHRGSSRFLVPTVI